MRTILDDARLELESARYKAWAQAHPIDDRKVRLELAGDRRPTAGSPYARLLIEAIRVGLAQSPPAEPAPLPIDVARRVMFTAWNPDAALRCPPGWTVALSADPAFDGPVRAAAPRLKAKGLRVVVWGVQTQTGVDRIRRLGEELDAAYLIFQAETVEEYDTAIAAGARFLVGNPNAWTDAQRADATSRANRGELAVLFETYSNQGDPWPDASSAQGVPMTSYVLGVGWGSRPYQLNDYAFHTPPGVWHTMSVYLAETLDDSSWAVLPS